MKILIIEDEKSISHEIENYLKSFDFQTEKASSFHDAMDKISVHDYDCILLDLMLPDGNGFQLLQYLKSQNKTDGVIIISAKQNIETKLEGFQLGADDYLTKPFHLSELLMRIQALLRRKNFSGNNLIKFEEITIDILAKTVSINENLVDFTRKEYDLLLYFLANQNKVLSKSAIAEYLSGDMADMMDNYDFIYAHIKNIKKKITHANGKDYIKTIYGMGYRWQNE